MEVLYDAYYEELEQYAYRQQHNYTTVIRRKSTIRPKEEDDDNLSTKSNQSEELSNTLTVQGSIITVADDLLKNDGKKFLDMMERLAERKMRKEREVTESDEEEDDDDDDEEEDEEEEDDEHEEDEDEDDEEDEEEVLFISILIHYHSRISLGLANRRAAYGRREKDVSSICCSYV